VSAPFAAAAAAGDPFAAFNFRVEIVPAGADAPLCDAAFAECDGLELRFDVQRLREGGDNARQRLFAGPASCGEVTLRRGMTASADLWDWCEGVMRDPSLRADAAVTVLAPDGASERARFLLARCLPLRLRAPRLDAVDGVVAIEELTLVCEALTLRRRGGPRPPGVPVKAVLEALDGPEEGRRVALQFNPRSLRLARGEDGRETLAFEVFYDVGPEDDVRRLTAPISRVADVPVRFEWGELRFDGRIVALDQELDFFSPEGRPLRAALALTLRRNPERPRPE
jgi:phage tail-like protein